MTRNRTFIRDDGETELDDLGESFLGLLPPGAELRRLVKSMGPQHPPATRIEALHAIARLSPGDLVNSEHWSTVKTHLKRLYEKTGARRHADLVKLFAGYNSPLLGWIFQSERWRPVPFPRERVPRSGDAPHHPPGQQRENKADCRKPHDDHGTQRRVG